MGLNVESDSEGHDVRCMSSVCGDSYAGRIRGGLGSVMA